MRARASMATRTSSSQSRSSGADVTSPRRSASRASSGAPIRARSVSDRRGVLVEAGLQARETVDGRQTAKTDVGQDHAGVAVGQHVDAIGGQGQFEQAAGKARIRLDQRVDRPRGHLETRERPPHHAKHFANEPVLLMCQERRIAGQHGVRVAARFHDPQPDIRVVRPQHQNRVVQLTGHLERPPARAGGDDVLECIGHGPFGSGYRQGGDALPGVDRHVDILIVIAGRHHPSAPSGESTMPRASAGRSLSAARARARPATYASKASGLTTASTSPQSFARSSFRAIRRRAEDIRQIAPHVPLVGHSRQSAGARQDAEQRHLRQAHG